MPQTLSPDQVKALGWSPPATASTPSQGQTLSPEQVKALGWTVPATISGAGGDTADHSGGLLGSIGRGISNFGTGVKNAFTGGINQAAQGVAEANPTAGNGIGGLVGGVGKILGGATNAFYAPVAPLTAPIGSAINAVADKISDVPAVQQFANSPAGQTTANVAENVANYATAAQGVAGLASAPQVANATRAGLGTASDALRTSANASTDAARLNFVKDLVTPEQTAKTLTGEIKQGRVSEGGYIFKGRDVAPTPISQSVIDTVNAIPDIKKGTVLNNVNVLHDAIGATAQDLRTQLQQSPIIFPKQEALSFISRAKDDLANNPLIVGDAEKTASKILVKFQQLVDQNPGTGEGILNARQQLDQWARSQKGDAVFDPAKESAVSIALRTVRQGANNFLAEKTPNVPVKALLSKQTDMYNAIDAMAPKAAKEAQTSLGRGLVKTGNLLGTKSKIVQGVAAASGIGGLGAAAFFAPPAALAIGAGALGYSAYRGLTSPILRNVAATTLEKASNIAPNVAGYAAGSDLRNSTNRTNDIPAQTSKNAIPPNPTTPAPKVQATKTPVATKPPVEAPNQPKTAPTATEPTKTGLGATPDPYRAMRAKLKDGEILVRDKNGKIGGIPKEDFDPNEYLKI